MRTVFVCKRSLHSAEAGIAAARSANRAAVGRHICYARVSTDDQGRNSQLDKLRAAGCALVLAALPLQGGSARWIESMDETRIEQRSGEFSFGRRIRAIRRPTKIARATGSGIIGDVAAVYVGGTLALPHAVAPVGRTDDPGSIRDAPRQLRWPNGEPA